MNKAFEKILDMLKDTAKIEIQLHCGRCNGKTLALGYTKGIENAIKIVQEVAEEYNDGWIASSSGNMPNNGQKVYVEFNDGKHMCLVYRTKDSRDKSNGWEMNITQDGFYEICSDYGYMPYRNIIAWQPLPEPFKESESE